MDETWRYSAQAVTKYNPIYRDENGHFKKDEWLGFFQVGKIINGQLFSLESYLDVESKYIAAARIFFSFHNCASVLLKNVEKYGTLDYNLADRREMMMVYDKIEDGFVVSLDNLDAVIKLVLRELVWAELFCDFDQSVVVRFGYDFYMYFNSDENWDSIKERITHLGLFIDR
jgi:hypothetical protein